ncbi:hypothetical protein GCM10010252_06880 [Streptomyces aureoverticillatus]|nr:hypothetical protein GCM10010252_06880 [Streptomyces aureoverticillatus]
MSARTFVLGREDKDAASADLHRLAAVIRRSGMASRYGVSVHRVPGSSSWGVYLTDRTPELGPPDEWARGVVLAFGVAA